MWKIQSVGKDVEKLKFPYTARGNVNTVENNLAFFFTVEHGVTIRSSNCILRYVPKRTENICPYKTLYMNVNSSITPNSYKVETMNE